MTPEQSSFLSLRFQNQRSYYQNNEAVPVKIYALKAPKKTYTLKLCHLPLEQYAYGERILSENMTGASLDTIYDILGGQDVFSCVKKDVDLSGSGYVSRLDIRSFASDGALSP